MGVSRCFGGKTRHPSSLAAARLNDGVSPSTKRPRPHHTNKMEGRHILGRNIDKDMQRLRAERMVRVVGIQGGQERGQRGKSVAFLFRAAPNYSYWTSLVFSAHSLFFLC